MTFLCGFLKSELVEENCFEVKASQLRGKWLKLYLDLFETRPATAMAVWSMPSGIYTLTRIR